VSNSGKGGTPSAISRRFPHRVSGIHEAKGFLRNLGREAEAALGAKKAGVVVDIWKCVGTRRVIAVVNVDSPDTVDQMLLDLPLMKEHGQHVHVDVTPLRRLEDFAADVKKRLQ
jgi:muconolactone delta-isomerase